MQWLSCVSRFILRYQTSCDCHHDRIQLWNTFVSTPTYDYSVLSSPDIACFNVWYNDSFSRFCLPLYSVCVIKKAFKMSMPGLHLRYQKGAALILWFRNVGSENAILRARPPVNTSSCWPCSPVRNTLETPKPKPITLKHFMDFFIIRHTKDVCMADVQIP